ncbi:MAG: hypothetical protein WB985_03990 [Candidatus Acidiferrales bacterium]
MAKETRSPGSSNKKAVVQLLDRTAIKGYLSPNGLAQAETVDLLTQDGEHKQINLASVRAIYFVRELGDPFPLERKTFLSRPKLNGLWVRLRFRDEEVIEGLAANDLVELLDGGIQLTPPDLHGNTMRLFIPRSAIEEMKVLGVVGIARRGPREFRPTVPSSQSKLFTD